MSDELENAPEGVDPLATSLALVGASRAKADAFLDDQRHHMREQIKQIDLKLWELRLSVFLRLATALVGVGVAGALGFMIWSAAHSNGLMIEPFSVPPDLAERGLTGQVMAAKLQDRLALMERNTNSLRPAKSYANSWGEHAIKLDIPETGISLTELENFLRAKLGHDIHVSGEVVHASSGLVLTARAGDEGANSVAGPEAEIDSMVQRTAESVYRITQPFRYGMFLVTNGRGPEALPIFEKLAKTGDKEDRLWSYNRWGTSIADRDGLDAGIRVLRQAIADDPDAIGAYDNLANILAYKGRSEDSLQAMRTLWTHLTNGKQTYIPASRLPIFERIVQARLDADLGAYHQAAETFSDVGRIGFPGFSVFNLTGPLITERIGEHDLVAGREAVEVYDSASGRRFASQVLVARMQLAQHEENWHAVLALADAAAPDIRKRPMLVPMATIVPLTALADAHLAGFDRAQALIGPTAADCYSCLRVRAQIAELQRQHDRADFWFAQALGQGPSLPFAEAESGQALLARGQPDAAIEKFKLSNAKGPHFADPLEGWGEALMAKNHSDQAIIKFAEAEKYSPNWGRLHLKWGEALVYAGKKDEAKVQFVRAGQLDLTATDKAELARQSPHA
jgi:hypothetical protein